MQITFFDSGSTMAFENGEPVPIARKSWLLVFAEYLKEQGINPEEQRFVLPDGRKAEVFKTSEGDYNRSIEP